MKFLKRRRQAKIISKIEAYAFPLYLKDKVGKTLGRALSEEEFIDIQEALKNFFKAWVYSDALGVSMTSFGADALWHEFILNTREYGRFCASVLGGFLHHTTNEARVLDQKMQKKNTLRTWELCCQVHHMESFDIYTKKALCPLFELDKKLGIYQEGFIWFATHVEKEVFLLSHPDLNVKNINVIENLFVEK